jgi:hypothetical protein
MSLKVLFSRRPDGYPSQQNTDHVRKLRGLYVDYSAGTVLLPQDITAAEARELADDAEIALTGCASAAVRMPGPRVAVVHLETLGDGSN